MSLPQPRVWLLALAALAGLALAAGDLLQGGPGGELPPQAVARVGEVYISGERYAQLLHDLASDRREPLAEDDRRFVVQRLIDEELLIQRGLDLGLAVSEPGVRKSLAASVIAQVAAEAAAAPVAEAALRDLYRADPGFFAVDGRYRVRWFTPDQPGAAGHARAAAVRGAWEAGAAAGFAHGSVPLPDSLLPPAKLQDYLGAELTRQVMRLAPGQIVGPVHAGGAWHVLQLLDHEAGAVPTYAAARSMVEAEYRRRRGDAALRDYLRRLRGEAEIEVAWERVLER